MITAQRSWKLSTTDIETAFLQGEKIERDIYLIPPKEASRNKVWKLHKCVYSLSGASSNDRAKTFMMKEGLKMSIADRAVFHKYNNGYSEGFLDVHRDDFYWSGKEQFEQTVISRLRSTFKVGKEKSEDLTYVGLSVSQG